VNKVRGIVDKALDTAINFIIGKAKALFAKLFSKKKDEEDPEKRLKKVAAELKPAVTALLAKGSKGLIFKAKLLAWKLKYRLSSLELKGRQIIAAINPELPVGEAVNQNPGDVRTQTHAAAVDVFDMTDVKKAAEDMVKQKQGGKGTLQDPIVVDPRGGLLAAGAALQTGAMATQPRETTAWLIPGSQTPVVTQQTFSPYPSHTIVGPRDSPNPVGRYANYQAHLASLGLTDVDARAAVALLAQGKPLPANLKPHEGFLSGLTFLLGATEPARIPAQVGAMAAALQQPPKPGGHLPHETPAGPVGAVAANRQANVQAGVPGASLTKAKPEVVKQVIQSQLTLTEAAIIQELESGQLVFANPEALQNFLKTDLRGMVKKHAIAAFKIGG